MYTQWIFHEAESWGECAIISLKPHTPNKLIVASYKQADRKYSTRESDVTCIIIYAPQDTYAMRSKIMQDPFLQGVLWVSVKKDYIIIMEYENVKSYLGWDYRLHEFSGVRLLCSGCFSGLGILNGHPNYTQPTRSKYLFHPVLLHINYWHIFEICISSFTELQLIRNVHLNDWLT